MNTALPKGKSLSIAIVIGAVLLIILLMARGPPSGGVIVRDIETQDDPWKGWDDASIEIIEFCDFANPECRKFSFVLERLRENYNRELKIVYKDYLDEEEYPSGLMAAEAAECADEQEMFWDMHDSFLEDQFALDEANIKLHAQSIGLDMDQFDLCLESGIMRIEIENDRKNGRRAGVSSTPTFFVNGRKYTGLIEYKDLSIIVDRALQEE